MGERDKAGRDKEARTDSERKREARRERERENGIVEKRNEKGVIKGAVGTVGARRREEEDIARVKAEGGTA